MSKQCLTAYITGLGSYLPERILTNTDLEKLVNTTDDWIQSRTGMRERRIAAEGEYTSDMGLRAAQEALIDAGETSSAIDLIIVATLSPDYIFPSTACIIQEKLGITAAAFDIGAACSGMIYAISMAKAYVQSGIYKNILVIASEKVSPFIDYEDRNTCVLFGDGAAACVVSSKPKGLKIGAIVLGADGQQKDLLLLPAGGVRLPASKETVLGRKHFIQMDGKEVFRHAVRRMESCAKKCLEKAAIKEEEIAYLIPHQANIRIIDAISKRLSIPGEKIVKVVDKLGNTCASSVGIGLDELMRSKKVNRGDHLLSVAFGAGLTWGSMLLTAEDEHEKS